MSRVACFYMIGGGITLLFFPKVVLKIYLKFRLLTRVFRPRGSNPLGWGDNERFERMFFISLKIIGACYIVIGSLLYGRTV